MFKVNDTVTYGINGICKIADISEQVTGTRRAEYYILKPAANPATSIFVPTQSEELTRKMKRLLTADEIIALIKSIPKDCDIWIDDGKVRREEYRKILFRSDRTELVRLIKTLFDRQQKLSQNPKSKQLASEDKSILETAEEILAGEFAYVLNVQREEIPSYILGILEA
jgi:CarD family transcriptional regulator